MREQSGNAAKNRKPFLITAIIFLGLTLTRLAAAPAENCEVNLAVEPAGGLTIPVTGMAARFYPALDPDGRETVVTITSRTSEPNKNHPDTWYIWIRAGEAALHGPDPIPVSRLFWRANQAGSDNRLSPQWVRIAVHSGTKHDPPARDTVRLRLQWDKNDLFSAGSYQVAVEYNVSHDPDWPQN